MSIKWIPIRDWAFTQGEEFLVIVEGEYKPDRKLCTAKLINTRIVTDWFHNDFSSDQPYRMVSPNGSHTITYAAELEYPRTLEIKYSDYFCDKGLDGRDIIKDLVRIAKHHYEDKP